MREKQPALILTFASTTQAMAVERFCGQNQLPGRLIPVPKEITAGCGLAWKAGVEQEDILTATASRRMEQRLMRAIPVLLVFYMELTSPGFFQVLYTTALGRLIMTCCLGAYFTACKLAELFLEIEV